MNVPLKWLSNYVELPKKVEELTDRLTMIGHMLDKTKHFNNETVIDLELRGNRSDMFGLIGVARDISAAFHTPLKLPQVSPLPKTDSKSSLVSVEKSAAPFVRRYIAVKLEVEVKSSPEWLSNSLKSYGIEPINNVVDVTNYCMIETSHPMHAFDYDKLDGGKLILRASKNHEKFQTIQQGTELILTPDDLAICDSSSVQGLSTIGGLKTKVTSSTHQIILETAVYSPAQSRRTARRHKTFTESSLRHEKHQDPSELNFVLARAVYLLQEVASAKVVSQISDYYPRPVAPLELAFDPQDITKLTGVNVSTTDLTTKLTDLGFKTISHTPQLLLTVPPFRTDIESSADVVEEVIRLVGYDKIPQTPLSGPIPPPQTYPSYLVQEKIRDILTSLRLNEVITSTMTDNKSTNSISLLNPPDPTMPYLRTQLSQQLIPYAQKLLARNIQSLAFFEIGKVFHSHKNQYLESLHLSICLAGNISRSNWRVTHPRPYDIYDLTGLIDTFKLLTGYQDLTVEFSNTDNIFCCEINLDNLGLPKQVTQAYDTISQFPAVIEDVNVPCDTSYANLETKVRKLSPLIKSIELVDKYQNRLTLRITFHSSTHQLSKQETSVITQKISNL